MFATEHSDLPPPDTHRPRDNLANGVRTFRRHRFRTA